MKLSNYFLPILKENPSEAKIKSHQLMLRAGMIRQSASGIYSWLPMGPGTGVRRPVQVEHEDRVLGDAEGMRADHSQRNASKLCPIARAQRLH